MSPTGRPPRDRDGELLTPAEVEARNRAIAADALEGATYAEIAADVGLSKQRVYQIVQAYTTPAQRRLRRMRIAADRWGRMPPTS